MALYGQQKQQQQHQCTTTKTARPPYNRGGIGRLFWGFVVAFPLDGVPKNSSSLTLPQIRSKNQQLHAGLDIGPCVGGNVGQIEWKGIKLLEGFVLQ